jgi:hypothetical protein
VKESFRFDSFNINEAKRIAAQLAGQAYNTELETVLTVAFSDKRNLPTLRFSENKTVELVKYIEKWVYAYLRGYNNRPSNRVGSKSATFPDSIVKLIMQSRLPNIDNELADKIEGGHSLMMTIENLVGDMLEEYLSARLRENGWCCCWGSTIDAVDFCKADGSLIQVKNSDNSENSSSSRVRAGTEIQKWFRRVSTRADKYVWGSLNEMVGRSDLSENDFRRFVINVIETNPSCLYVEDNHLLI